MTFRPWLLTSSLVSAVLTWIVYREYTSDVATSGAWGCEMSWMTPSYVEIPWPDTPLSRYRLFWYREQGWDNEEEVCSRTGPATCITKRVDSQPTGLPVIFIPGNAGSYTQVRSIASSASRQYYGETMGRDELPPGTAKLDFYTGD
jgi:glycosylphosphatidylinositol deacylase